MRPLRLTIVAVLTTCLALAGCSNGAGSDNGDAASTPGGAAGDAFPFTITSALGTAEIKAAPQRVVTLGWGSTDAAIALGVYPVAIEKQAYGANADGVLPWVADALEKAGQPTPTLLPSANTAAPAYEQIIAAKPDLILAPYSGIDKDQYAKLSKIAPTVGYPDKPWATKWEDIIKITAKALGRTQAGDDVFARINTFYDEQKSAHPELVGKTFASVWDNPTQNGIFVYTDADARVQVLTALGLEVAPAVKSLYSGNTSFYYTLSYEKLDQLDADALVLFADEQKQASDFLARPQAKGMQSVADGRVASVVGQEYVAAVSPPTALSFDYGMPKVIDALSEAVKK